MRVVRYILLILGGLAAAVLVISCASNAQTLDRGWLAWWPECEARRAGSRCMLCGMSHAFVAISHGRWEEALSLNPYAAWVYAAFVAQALAALAIGARGMARFRRDTPSRVRSSWMPLRPCSAEAAKRRPAAPLVT
jgi:hypothetical protein